MYCRKCGKWIDYDAEICTDCKETDEFFSDNNLSAQPTAAVNACAAQPVEGSRKTGFGKALTATILGAVAYFVVMFGYGLLLGALEELEEYDYYYAYETVKDVLTELNLYGAAIFCVIAPIAASIPGLILGIQSIRCFKREKNAGRLKPIATLVLGIVGVALAALTLFLALILALCLAI